jgi:two-component system, NarL family, sensor kinase
VKTAVSSLGRLVMRSTRPLLHAIRTLSPDFENIALQWRRSLEQVTASRRELDALAAMNPQKVLEGFPKSGFAGFRRTLSTQGERLAAENVALEHAITASRDYLKLCLQSLPRRNAATRAMAVSLVRLTSVGQLFLISGYTSFRATRLSELQENLTAAEEKLHSLSRIINDVYDQERRSISRDLHDEVGHDLIVLKLYLEMIGRDILQQRNVKLQRNLQEAIDLVCKAIERVRQLSFDLGPAISNELGFASALRLYVRQFAKRTGIRVGLRVSGFDGPSLPSTHEMTLYRVLQGALSNVGQHSKATRVQIGLAWRKDRVRMTISDNGVGFPVKRVLGADRAFGVMTMRERVELLGGEFRIESLPRSRRNDAQGTTIDVLLPVFAAQD